MKIIEVTPNKFRGEIISNTFLFEDDKSVDIDIQDNTVCDSDGFSVVPRSRLKKIEDRMGVRIGG